MKQLDKIFFNSVEEMNECYGIDAELPSNLYSNADLVCYEIVEPFICEYIGQYVFTRNGFQNLSKHGKPNNNHNEITSELEVREYDLDRYEGRCFVYVRVNEYLRKQLEKTLNKPEKSTVFCASDHRLLMLLHIFLIGFFCFLC